MPTATELVNDALVLIRGGSIQDLWTSTEEEADIARRVLRRVRRTVFSYHGWNCLLRQATLAKDSNTPLFTYNAKYRLPSDCLRAWMINGELIYGNRFSRMGDFVYTLDTYETVELLYVQDTDDLSRMSPHLEEVFVMRLAQQISMGVTGKKNIKRISKQEFDEALYTAMYLDSTEGTPEAQVGRNDWLEARLGGDPTFSG